MKITTTAEARERVNSKIPHDSFVSLAWTRGNAWYFRELTNNGTRRLWRIGPRGAINITLSLTEYEWETLR